MTPETYNETYNIKSIEKRQIQESGANISKRVDSIESIISFVTEKLTDSEVITQKTLERVYFAIHGAIELCQKELTEEQKIIPGHFELRKDISELEERLGDFETILMVSTKFNKKSIKEQ